MNDQQLSECYKRYHADELRWDWHTNIGQIPRGVLEAEFTRRGVPACGEMRRRGGPFIPNSRYTGYCTGCQFAVSVLRSMFDKRFNRSRKINAAIDRGKYITFFKVT